MRSLTRAALYVGIVASGLASCAAPRAEAAAPVPTDSPYVLVLGTAQDGGMPQIACTCDACEAAREDPGTRRLVTSLLLVDPTSGERWLFDAGPELPEQVELARGHGRRGEAAHAGRPALFDGVFITHAHLGHYAGLLYLGREAYGSEPMTVFGTPRLLDFLGGNGPWSLLFGAGHAKGRALAPGATASLTESLSVTAIEVPHRDEFSDTVAFRIQGPAHALLYLPDIDKWDRWGTPLEDVLKTVDYALIDGTFYGPDELPGRDMAQVPHPFIVESMARLAPLAAGERAKVYFTHLNHSNPAAAPGGEAAARVSRAGFHVLDEGTVFGL